MYNLASRPNHRNAGARTTPRLEIIARDVIDALNDSPIRPVGVGPGELSAQFRLGIIEVDSSDCTSRGHFLLAYWINGSPGVVVYRTDPTGQRADLVAELSTTSPLAIADVIARRMVVIAELEADGVPDPVIGSDTDLLPDRTIGVDSMGNDISESDIPAERYVMPRGLAEFLANPTCALD